MHKASQNSCISLLSNCFSIIRYQLIEGSHIYIQWLLYIKSLIFLVVIVANGSAFYPLGEIINCYHNILDSSFGLREAILSNQFPTW